MNRRPERTKALNVGMRHEWLNQKEISALGGDFQSLAP
jgi:hypothetical protein